jgi:hypothetical protein
MTPGLRRVAAASIVAFIVWAFVALPVRAGSDEAGAHIVAAQNEYGITCLAGRCRLEVALGAAPAGALQGTQVVLETLEKNLRLLPDGAGFEINDRLTLRLPAALLELGDASMRAQVGAGGELQALHGEARLRIPTLGLMPGWDSVTPVALRLGFDRGEVLHGLGAPLHPDRIYLFVDVGAGLLWTPAGTQQQDVQLGLPSGQRATLVIDPLNPFIYFDGNITVRVDGELALLQLFWSDLPAEGVPWVEWLPLRQTAGLHITGVAGPEWQESSLAVQGRYLVDAGWAGRWVQIEETPFAIEGRLAFSREGFLVAGATELNLWPDTLLDSGLALQLFVPLESGDSESLVALEGRLSLPLAGINAQGAFAINQGQAGTLVAGIQEPLSLWWQEHSGWGADATVDALAATRAGYEWSQAQLEVGVEWVAGSWMWSRDQVDSGRQWLFPLAPIEQAESVAIAHEQ